LSSSKPWRYHLVRGARCLEQGDFAGAQHHFAAAYYAAPEEPIVCVAWGRELLRAGDVAGAEPLVRLAWERDPTLLSAGFTLARLLGLHRGRPIEAIAILDRVDRGHGVSATTLLLRGELALQPPAEPGEARQLFERASALGADEALVRVGLAKAYNAEGIACSEVGEHHQALFALKRAADLDPTWPGPLTNSGAVFERLGMGRQARSHYRAALRLDPRSPVALFNLADSLRRGGCPDEAARLYRRLLRVQPDYPGAREGLAQVRPPRPVRPRRPPHRPTDHPSPAD
jgi:Flp pilus assembly protein TadD